MENCGYTHVRAIGILLLTIPTHNKIEKLIEVGEKLKQTLKLILQ